MSDFSRDAMLARADGKAFDVLVVGGGATGLGVAVDAASRGYSTCLVESYDFAKGTSSRSTKLVHGGVRYLEQLDIALVMEALHERGLMHQNAPHLVHDLAFLVPRYTWWEGPFYGAGLKLYDVLAGKRNLAPSRFLSLDETIAAIPSVSRDGLLGSVEYHDGQFDDARMALALARTAAELGAVVINQVRVNALRKDGNGRVCGVDATDVESGRALAMRATVVVNACGIFSDELRVLDDGTTPRMIEPAQGVHLVFDRALQPSDRAIMVPHTDDGRVLFVIPWHERIVVGTTDTPMKRAEIEPRALPDEIEFILRNAGRYLEREPARGDVRAIYAGMRPLVHESGVDSPTKSISRSHKVVVSASGLVSIMGGKWTTYRRMAQDTMSRVIDVGQLEPRPCVTESLRVHGWLARDDAATPSEDWMRVYGCDAPAVRAVCGEKSGWNASMHARLPYALGVAAYAVRHEMARSTEDVLARRTRALLLDAAAASEVAEQVAKVVANELGRDGAWAARDAAAFRELAKGYQLTD
ncbi:MAG: glycerol-3-phosphate dehydrogenase/oxidase [Phycisphaerales bacterium]|nr:glycerol-3-phosphate dehydrogenase/oxidase [Phycisphaerales bacterium]